MKTLHTPGPWTADKDGFIRAKKHTINVAVNTRMAMGTNVAFCCADRVSKARKSSLPVKPQYEANARLIAAAPMLLKAAKRMVEILEMNPRYAQDHRPELVKAIRKAEGRT